MDPGFTTEQGRKLKGEVTKLVRRFDNSAMYKEWKKQRSAIPKIDFNVSEEEGFFINIKAWGDYQVSEEEFN